MINPEMNLNEDEAIVLPDPNGREFRSAVDLENTDASREKEHNPNFLALKGYADNKVAEKAENTASKLMIMLADKYGVRAARLAGNATMIIFGTWTGAKIAGNVSSEIFMADVVDLMGQKRIGAKLEKMIASKDRVSLIRRRYADKLRKKIINAKEGTTDVAS